jgi:hypothetical protein
MPRPHYPLRGGAQIQPRYGSSGSSDASGDCEQCKAKSTELDRMRQELARLRQDAAVGARPPLVAGAGMVWAALAICGGGLLFALIAILRHG